MRTSRSRKTGYNYATDTNLGVLALTQTTLAEAASKGTFMRLVSNPSPTVSKASMLMLSLRCWQLGPCCVFLKKSIMPVSNHSAPPNRTLHKNSGSAACSTAQAARNQ
jgi:hypothetical protein